MVRSLRREEFDPRPLNRQTDLATQKVEYDSDTSRINDRTRAMNRAARVSYQQDMAARNYAQRQKKPAEQDSIASRISSGLRRAFA